MIVEGVVVDRDREILHELDATLRINHRIIPSRQTPRDLRYTRLLISQDNARRVFSGYPHSFFTAVYPGRLVGTFASWIYTPAISPHINSVSLCRSLKSSGLVAHLRIRQRGRGILAWIVWVGIVNTAVTHA